MRTSSFKNLGHCLSGFHAEEDLLGTSQGQ